MPQVAIYPCLLAVLMALCLVTALWVALILETALLFMLILSLAFFRDPHRDVPADKNVLLAPADGKVTDINIIEEAPLLGGKAIIIGIFMSIFNVHINRSPCAAKVEKISYKKGRHKNAMNPESSRTNESNDMALVRLDEPRDRLLVRQISGAIARHIVCAAEPGQHLSPGEKFGMVKFGSRVELYLPVGPNVNCLVKVGDKVKAGLTILARYEHCHQRESDV